MSLAEFQRATAEFVASPERCVRAGADFDAEVREFALDERERRRLRAMLADRGMSVNCTLYRVNRFVTIFSVLPLTCRLLGAAARTELEEFWRHSPATLQYRDEAHAFGAWLRQRMAAGAIPPGQAADVLRAELAAFDLATGDPPAPAEATGDPTDPAEATGDPTDPAAGGHDQR
ncbi:hypothetical protein ABT294_37275 [Nonomuraea sp. NPDC000554]|uniref:hypothetical protein n=1 Tax=Nonomuraea sp. NPDC000554 TaxID=3154259 RepID=UPI0033315C3A